MSFRERWLIGLLSYDYMTVRANVNPCFRQFRQGLGLPNFRLPISNADLRFGWFFYGALGKGPLRLCQPPGPTHNLFRNPCRRFFKRVSPRRTVMAVNSFVML